MTISPVTQNHVDKLLADLRAVVHDGQEVLKSGAADMSEKGKEARARLEEALQRGRQTCEEYEAKAGDTARAAEQVIRDHPVTSVGLAFGVGVLMGVLINRR